MESIIFLNTFLITPSTILRKRQSVRYPKILPFLAKWGPSVIGLSEVFKGFCGKMTREATKYGYRSVCDRKGFIQTSGLMFLWDPRRWEYVSSVSKKFTSCSGFDCLARKGFLVVKLEHVGTGEVVHFIVTHLNANQKKEAYTYEVQYKQLKLIRKYIRDNIGRKEKVVIMGDFNIDISKDPDTVFDELIKLGDLDATEEFTTNTYDNEDIEILDYIITRNIKHSKTKVLQFKKNDILSDHNAILKKINLGR